MGNQILRPGNVRKTLNYLKKNGIYHAYYAAKERIGEERAANYRYEEPSEAVLCAQRKETLAFPYLFSIVVPAYETKEEFLREMISSVRRQSYEKWELILVDASRSDKVKRIVEQIAREGKDARMKYRRLAENKGISDNTNEGIELAEGDYIALLDHDDFLAPDALYHMAMTLHKCKQRGISPVLLYTDEDKYDNNGRCYISPNRKEKFNLDLILSNNYICHFMAAEGRMMKSMKLRREYDGAQDYDFVLRTAGELLKNTPAIKLEEKIVHIPQVLYHWRCHSDSTAENTASKSYAYEAGKAAILDFCKRRGWKVSVSHSLHLGFYEIAYEPDILSVRKDIGVVGGRLLDRNNRICGGMYDETGKLVYEGLHREYSGGSTHRASLVQDCAAVDIRFLQVREELWPVFREVTGVEYSERMIKRSVFGGRDAHMPYADVSALNCDEMGYRKLSFELCKSVSSLGYQILWNPHLTLKMGRQ